MFRKKIQSVFMLMATALSFSIYGQAYITDAGRFSSSTLQGTARIQALGGAQNSLGGDMSTLAGNPAGLGVYRKSEFGFSTAMQFGRTQNTFDTGSDVTQTISNRNNFNIPNFAFIISNEEGVTSTKAWKGGSWGISYTRTNDFQNRRKFSGNNEFNSLRTSLAEQSQGIDEGDYSNDSLLIVYDASGGRGTVYSTSDIFSDLMVQGYWSDLFSYSGSNPVAHDAGVSTFQQGEILTKGSQSQWDISYGNNYMDRLYIGAGLGIGLLRYIEEVDYTESVSSSELDSYNLSSTLDQRGTGLFFKTGFIYRVTDLVRISSTIQSPTWYFMTEDYESILTVDWDSPSPGVGFSYYDYSGGLIENQYMFRSPMRWTSGISTFLGKHGFITADFEYVPYKQAKFSPEYFEDPGFDEENAEIKRRYNNVWNVRIGAELRFRNIFVRGGYAYFADPTNIDEKVEVDRGKRYLTGGLGIRLGDHHFDFALVNERYEAYYNQYEMNDGSESYTVSKTSNIRGVLTWGVYLY